MQSLLAAMHDQNKHITKFKAHFNGDSTKTIRFIFDINRYSEITHFKDPHSIFIHIYNALDEHIQSRIAIDKQNVIAKQIKAQQTLEMPIETTKQIQYLLINMKKHKFIQLSLLKNS